MTYKMKYLLVACLMVMASTCMAMTQLQQPNDGNKPGNAQRKRPNMEQLTKMQASRISQSWAWMTRPVKSLSKPSASVARRWVPPVRIAMARREPR